MKRISAVASVAVLLLVMGCIVIPDTFDANINVTIRHIEEQAGQILDYVEGKTDTLPGLEGPGDDQSSLLRGLVDFLAPVRVAYAAELKDSSPRVAQIAQKMKGRYAEVKAVKATGAVGESNRGLLELVKPELISGTEETNRVQRIIGAENGDRKALYQEVARLNKDQNLNVGKVEQVYARGRLERAQSGDLFQLPSAGQDFDAFKASRAGQRLAAKCVPRAWVTIP